MYVWVSMCVQHHTDMCGVRRAGPALLRKLIQFPSQPLPEDGAAIQHGLPSRDLRISQALGLASATRQSSGRPHTCPHWHSYVDIAVCALTCSYVIHLQYHNYGPVTRDIKLHAMAVLSPSSFELQSPGLQSRQSPVLGAFFP